MTPIFNEVAQSHRFSVLPTSYTDTFTPEQARQAGEIYGRAEEKQRILTMLKKIKNPTKQITSFIDTLEWEQ